MSIITISAKYEWGILSKITTKGRVKVDNNTRKHKAFKNLAEHSK